MIANYLLSKVSQQLTHQFSDSLVSQSASDDMSGSDTDTVHVIQKFGLKMQPFDEKRVENHESLQA